MKLRTHVSTRIHLQSWANEALCSQHWRTDWDTKGRITCPTRGPEVSRTLQAWVKHFKALPLNRFGDWMCWKRIPVSLTSPSLAEGSWEANISIQQHTQASPVNITRSDQGLAPIAMTIWHLLARLYTRSSAPADEQNKFCSVPILNDSKNKCNIP